MAGFQCPVFTRLWIEALLANERLAELVWKAWDAGVITDEIAAWAKSLNKRKIDWAEQVKRAERHEAARVMQIVDNMLANAVEHKAKRVVMAKKSPSARTLSVSSVSTYRLLITVCD